MNIQSEEALKLKEIDQSQAEVNFCIFPQNHNEVGFISRFLDEEFAVEPVFQTKDGKINTDGDGRAGARFRVVIQKRQAAKVEEAAAEPVEKAAPVKKKATKKVTNG